MSKLMRNAVLVAKLQTNDHTPIAPAGANAMLCRAIAPRPVVAESAERNNIKPYLGHSGTVVTSVYSECEFEVEFAASGVAGTAPKWADLIRACAFSQTVTVGTSVVYAPITNNQEAVSIDIFIDGIRHRMTNAKGTVSFELKAKTIPTLKFKFTGFYNPVTDQSMPSGVDYSAFTDPVAVNSDNTPAWELHGYTGALDSVSFDLANQVIHRAMVGAESVLITDRKPTGNVLFEMNPIADKDWFAAVIAGDLGELTITHGTTAGKIIEISCPKTQLSDPSYSDQDGIQMIGLKTIYKPNIGNDELVITLT